MNNEDNFNSHFLRFISSFAPIIMGILWLFNVYYIGTTNNEAIKELKKEINEMRSEVTTMARKIDVIETTIKIKVK